MDKMLIGAGSAAAAYLAVGAIGPVKTAVGNNSMTIGGGAAVAGVAMIFLLGKEYETVAYAIAGAGVGIAATGFYPPAKLGVPVLVK